MPVYPMKSRAKVKAARNRYRIVVWHGGRPNEEVFEGKRADAEKREARLRLELAGRAPGVSRTVPGFCDFCLGAYAIHSEARHGKGTRRNRKYQIVTLIEFFQNKPLDRISSHDIEEFQRARLRPASTRKVTLPDGEVKVEKVRAVKAPKVNDDCKVLSAILGYAVKKKLIPRIPEWEPLPERKRSDRVQVWSEDEVLELYQALQEVAPRLLPITVVMINTGLRKGEALAMEWSWIDLDRGLLVVQPNEEWQPKNGRAREVPIGRAVMPYLDVPVDQRGSSRYVFTSSRRRNGARELSRWATWPQRLFDAAIARAGIGGGPHVCRHTFASHFLAQKPDMYLLSQILGHSSVKVTERRYAHLMPGHLAAGRDAVCIPAPIGLVDGDPRHGSAMVSSSRRGKQRRKRQ